MVRYIVPLLILLLPALGIALLMPSMTDENNAARLAYEAKPLLDAPQNTLSEYGIKNGSAMEDLRLLYYLTLSGLEQSEELASKHCASNEDLSKFLLGANEQKQRYLNPGHPAFSAENKLIDRWETPIDVRINADGNFIMRSHGLDKTPGTSDDIIWPLPR